MSFSVRVTHNGVADLARDLEAMPTRSAKAFAATTRRNVEAGNRLAIKFAQAGAGPHGKNYYKRISAEMTGPYSGEYGPTGDPKTNFVGVGFRHGTNMDLPNSADIIGPRFAKGINANVDRLFW